MKEFCNKRTIFYGGLVALILCIAGYWLFFSSFSSAKEEVMVRVDRDDNCDSIQAKLERVASPRQMLGFRILSGVVGMKKVRPGCYIAGGGISTLALFRNIRGGRQTPVKLTIPNVRTLGDLAARLSLQLELDSAQLASAFSDEALCQELGYDTTTIGCMFIPNTYEVFWNISAKDLMARLHKESNAFWTSKRKAEAKAAGLTPNEVIIMASIVDQETANSEEKPMVAGMYLNRLHQGMKLQADPTVKFALKQFALKRILHEHLSVDSPYNTYRHEGLPPGPIAIPALSSIEAVLHFAHHDYIYMCAKEDFSGTHNFAKTYEEHLANARKYAEALNERGIK